MPDILIVDDSISVRKALEITLRNHSLTSASAVSAEQALEMLAAKPEDYDLLMIDVIMPGMSGVELSEKLKADSRYAHLPIILMSGNVDEEVKDQAHDIGVAGLLKKPFKSEEVIPMVQDTLDNYRIDKGKRAVPQSGNEDDELLSVESTINSEALGALSDLLQTYEDDPRVRDVVILDREGHPIRQTGNVLPENIQMFARFFTNTAGVLGKQMLGEDIHDVTIRYGTHGMVIHNLPEHFVVVLLGESRESLKA